ncbi:M48 family metalloprotease [Gorillibacterium timonense]|uniref:M48 family metalloprotease n=1 Tax=Gorillibacterium timonense TaxID=1689269 RepID=UPI00071DC708|nr:M48 family metalloprotease [Gorillibacterium timonense]
MSGWVILMVFAPLMLIGAVPLSMARVTKKLELERLPDPELQDKLQRIHEQMELQPIEIGVWKAPESNRKAKIFLTGGSPRRLILSDVLLEQASVDEIGALATHEFAHWKLGHLKIRTGVMLLILGVLLPVVALGLVPAERIGWQALLTAAFLLLYLAIQLKGLRGWFEHEADRYVLGAGVPAETYLTALAVIEQGSGRNPDSVRPSLAARMKRIHEWKPTSA